MKEALEDREAAFSNDGRRGEERGGGLARR